MACLLLAAAVVTAAGCATGRPVPRPFPGAPLPPGAGEAAAPPAQPEPAPAAPSFEGSSAAAPPSRATLLSTALMFQGVPYRNGGSDPSGFDCSGFVQYVFARHGVPLPREVRDQYAAGAAVDLEEVQPGDLVFFETVSRGASHVGIALGDGSFVHAPSSRGVVRVESYGVRYWASRWVGARRVMTGTAAAE